MTETIVFTFKRVTDKYYEVLDTWDINKYTDKQQLAKSIEQSIIYTLQDYTENFEFTVDNIDEILVTGYVQYKLDSDIDYRDSVEIVGELIN